MISSAVLKIKKTNSGLQVWSIGQTANGPFFLFESKYRDPDYHPVDIQKKIKAMKNSKKKVADYRTIKLTAKLIDDYTDRSKKCFQFRKCNFSDQDVEGTEPFSVAKSSSEGKRIIYIVYKFKLNYFLYIIFN